MLDAALLNVQESIPRGVIEVDTSPQATEQAYARARCILMDSMHVICGESHRISASAPEASCCQGRVALADENVFKFNKSGKNRGHRPGCTLTLTSVACSMFLSDVPLG